MCANDHKGYMQCSSDDRWCKTSDPSRTRYQYRNEPTAYDGSGIIAKDWASALIKYMGGPESTDFQTAPVKQSKVFICPSDTWINNGAAYTMNNVSGANVLCCYGVNADISAGIDYSTNKGEPKYGTSDTMSVANATTKSTAGDGWPLEGKLSRVYQPVRGAAVCRLWRLQSDVSSEHLRRDAESHEHLGVFDQLRLQPHPEGSQRSNARGDGRGFLAAGADSAGSARRQWRRYSGDDKQDKKPRLDQRGLCRWACGECAL